MAESSHKRDGVRFPLALLTDYAGFRDADEYGEAELRVIQEILERLRLHDDVTYRHARSVGLWCRKLSLELGATASEADFIERCGALHDVGKMKTPLSILSKPGPLTTGEWETMRAHAAEGADMCAEHPMLARFATVVRTHHERIDGRGYPARLTGAEIPIEAQIVSVTDSFHAMISIRGYARAKEPKEAFRELERGSGTQFGVPIVAGFFSLVGWRGSAAAAAAERESKTA